MPLKANYVPAAIVFDCFYQSIQGACGDSQGRGKLANALMVMTVNKDGLLIDGAHETRVWLDLGRMTGVRVIGTTVADGFVIA